MVKHGHLVPAPPESIAGPDEVAALLRQVVTEQQRQGAQIDAILQALDRGRGARDHADADLIEAIKESFRDRTFTSGNVITLAQADAALAAALASADITSARELGHLLRRLEGVAIRGLLIERAPGASRFGILWRCELCEL